MTPKPIQTARTETESPDDRLLSAKLDEMARRYESRPPPKRSESPSPESAGAIRVELPGAKLSLRPSKLKPSFAWLIGILAMFGMTGAGVVAYFQELAAARARVAAVEAASREIEVQFAQFKAVQVSQGKRLKTLEGAPDAPLVVTK